MCVFACVFVCVCVCVCDRLHYVLFYFIQRPSAKELLKHPFIRRAKKTAYLQELIESYKNWKAKGGGNDEDSDDSDM